MEILRLANDSTYNVHEISDVNGLTVSILPDTSISEIFDTFSNPENTAVMKLETEGGDVIRIFNGYVDLFSLSLIHKQEDPEAETMTIVQAVFSQPDRVQEQIDELQNAVVELANLIVEG